MFLYELAVELDVRSAELVGIAEDLGLGAVSASTVLSPDQVARLRSHLGAPSAASFAPPVGPVSFAPPSNAVPPSFAPPSLEPPSFEPPSFEPPVRFEPVPLAAPAPMPPPMPAGQPIAGGPIPEPAGPGGFTRKQLVAIGSVIAVVVGLFGFMIATGGRDEARERAIAAGEADGPERTKPDIATTTSDPRSTSTTVATSPTLDPGADLSEPADLATFCTGGKALDPLLTRIVAAVYDKDIAELKDLVRTRRAEWDRALDQIVRGGPPMYADEADAFRTGMAAWFADVPGASSVEDSYLNVTYVGLARTFNAGDEFLRQIPYYCK